MKRKLPLLSLALIAIVAGCGGGDGDDGVTEGPAVEKMAEIRDRAVDDGYELLECVEGSDGDTEVKCVDEISVTSSDGELQIAGILVSKRGLWSSDYNRIKVDSYPDPEDLQEAVDGLQDDAGEREQLKTGKRAYVVVGDRLWWSESPDAKITKRDFREIVGKLEDCAPNCQFERPGATKSEATDSEAGVPTAKQTRATLAPIIRRSKAAGYDVSPPTGSVVSITGEGTDAVLSVFASPAAAREAGSLSAETIEEGTAGADFAVIGNRAWETFTPDKTEQFRKLVETAEGCGSDCRFSMSSFDN